MTPENIQAIGQAAAYVVTAFGAAIGTYYTMKARAKKDMGVKQKELQDMCTTCDDHAEIKASVALIPHISDDTKEVKIQLNKMNDKLDKFIDGVTTILRQHEGSIENIKGQLK